MMMSFSPVGGAGNMVPVFIPAGGGAGGQAGTLGPVAFNPATSIPQQQQQAFDYSSLNNLFQSPLFNFPQLQFAPIQNSYVGSNGQFVPYTVNYGILPATGLNQIQSAEQLKIIPAAGAGNLGSLFTLAGSTYAGNISGLNTGVSILPPALTLPTGLSLGNATTAMNTGGINTGLGTGFNFPAGGGTLGGGAGLIG